MVIACPAKLAEHDDRAHGRTRSYKISPYDKSLFFGAWCRAECIKLNGAMELAPVHGSVGRIVDLLKPGQP